MPRRKSAEDYEAEARYEGGCLLHGAFGVARHVYQLRHGELPGPHVQVCHHCDRPQCIVDSHHFLGSQLDNMRDALSKGRHASQTSAHKARVVELNKSPAKREAARTLNLGKKLPKETRLKMSKAHRGKPKSDAHRAAISAAVAASWVRRRSQ